MDSLVTARSAILRLFPPGLMDGGFCMQCMHSVVGICTSQGLHPVRNALQWRSDEDHLDTVPGTSGSSA